MDAKVVSTSLRQFADGRELRAAVTLADNSVQLVGFEFSEDYKRELYILIFITSHSTYFVTKPIIAMCVPIFIDTRFFLSLQL